MAIREVAGRFRAVEGGGVRPAIRPRRMVGKASGFAVGTSDLVKEEDGLI